MDTYKEESRSNEKIKKKFVQNITFIKSSGRKQRYY